MQNFLYILKMMMVGIKWCGIWMYLSAVTRFLKCPYLLCVGKYIFCRKNILNKVKLRKRESYSSSLSSTQTNNLNYCLEGYLPLSLLCR